jgi:translation initiation factor IF-2
MNDTKSPGDKQPLSLTGSKTLTLKRPVQAVEGTVRQSFSHGRSKTVVVEKVKRRIGNEGGPSAPAPAATPTQSPPQVQAPATGAPLSLRGKPAAIPSTKPTGVVLRTLTDEEKDARSQALSEARAREAVERARMEEQARLKSEREAAERAEREAAEARRREEEDRRREVEAAKRRGEEPAPIRSRFGVVDLNARFGPINPKPTPKSAVDSTVLAPSAPQSPRSASPTGGHVMRPAKVVDAGDDESPRGRVGLGKVAMVAKPEKKAAGPMKSRGRLTVTNAYEEGEERGRSVASFRRRVQRLTGKGQEQQKEKISREVVIPETITIQELGNRMAERAVDVIRLLMKQGTMKKINDVIDADTAQLIAEELGHTVRRVSDSDVEDGIFDTPDVDEALVSRAPVVTIMGHVDHGKTSLLDALRSAKVAAGEAGGITQHIGAYQVTAPNGGLITFIDTPGHAAFTAMRARGAKVTDIVVLVVAADDGVMPQTVEAISHAKAAGVPIIVAVNKIDKPEAKPERVRTELLQHEIVVESLGGDVLEVEVSAKQKLNLDKLLEGIALQAEILDLKSNPDRAAEGTVIEAKLDKGRGPVATVLVQRGTLKTGDIVVAGGEWGKVRALLDYTGKNVSEAGPAMPVEVLGFGGAPEAGDRVAVVENEARAREITDYRIRTKRDMAAARGGRVSLADMMSQLKSSNLKEMPLVIKADVQGSLEAIIGAVEKLGNDEVRARVIHSGVGGITESDVTLAEASKAVVIGFNVRAHREARDLSEQVGLEIRYYNIIYNLVDDVKGVLTGMLPPTLREETLGSAEILEIFAVSKVGKVAGCRVTDGVVQRGAHVRLIRDSVVIHEGKLSTLKRFKDEAKEVLAGQECGMAFENFQDMRAGDTIECYRVEEIQRSL